jgi:hypothetical protein
MSAFLPQGVLTHGAIPELSPTQELGISSPSGRADLPPIALDQPQRQASPADTGEDQRVLRRVVANSPRSGRQHAEVAPFGQR